MALSVGAGPQVTTGPNQAFSQIQSHLYSDSSTAQTDENGKFQFNVQNVLGKNIQLPPMNRNLDLYQGSSHSMTGIPYAIQGKASVINVEVGEYLTAFKDPIKVILGTSVHRESKVLVTRKYVTGGRSMITPEHAPARVVSVREDVREINLTRYGADVEMNLNLFLRPDDAKSELGLKISAQKRELERTLVEHGYRVLMDEGTDLVSAIMRSNPATSNLHMTDPMAAEIEADRINITSVFGAMSKNNFPLQSLMAAASYASAYTTSNEKGSVLLVPHGVPEMLRYMTKGSMEYYISGKKFNEGKALTMSYDDVYSDPSVGVKVLVRRPLPNFDYGVANPTVDGMNGLTDEVTFGMFYPIAGNDKYICDLKTRSLQEISLPTDPPFDGKYNETAITTTYTAATGTASASGLIKLARSRGTDGQCPLVVLDENDPTPFTEWFRRQMAASDSEQNANNRLNPIEAYMIWCTGAPKATATVDVTDMIKTEAEGQQVLVRPRLQAIMSSAILAAPGSDTGELMVGYPMTSVSTSASEIVRIQLRVYMSAVLKKPENVLVLRNVYFEGLSHGCGLSHDPEYKHDTNKDVYRLFVSKSHFKGTVLDLQKCSKCDSIPCAATSAGEAALAVQLGNSRILSYNDAAKKFEIRSDHPGRIYRGAVYKADGSRVVSNTGHLGELDHPERISAAFGTGFKYTGTMPMNA